MTARAAPFHFPYWPDNPRDMAGGDATKAIKRYEQCQTAFNRGNPNWRRAGDYYTGMA